MADLQSERRSPRFASPPTSTSPSATRARPGDFNPIHIDEEFARSRRAARAHPARAVDDGAGRARPDRGGRRPRAPQAAVRAVPRHGRARAGGLVSGHRSRGQPTVA